ncbi:MULTISPECIES: sensor histidine kinase [Flavobacteriaceae]|uniref:histidine kinase n=2 Tax=Flavobacteriaceae TaxID=49546 RepID=A0A1K1RYF6_9FLAO|nr:MULTISPECIES: HAMP domain-containing sensor histidine kinase [Flavobacteriaceae]MAZ27043.1 sensor histidine kinase [Cytophagaceae bacterium]MDG3581403.1 HAMP domain-containing sensor histidine kinase [Galbibacter pacificus]MDG3584881.1 HAMP domain-containing sensor histidine kinase [Galbibacter pacificus]SFW77105.1 Signal transduction histidine kinase [Sinomicrobium oceani]
MKLNFKNRIALHYIVATGLIIAVVFLGIFFVVKSSVYANLDKDLNFEVQKHTREIAITKDSIYFFNKKELEEREHTEVQVNPVFVQLSGKDGTLFDKSPNLKENQLTTSADQEAGQHFNALLADQPLRQVQLPIEKNGDLKGYVVAAMSLEGSIKVINNLGNTLLIIYPIVLFGLFFISSFLAGRSIAPIRSIISTTNNITRNNLNERVILPQKKDELHELSSAINDLLNRIERTIERERQFTSDASHELRTPLSSLSGTLEVLIQKERSQLEYEKKIGYSLGVIDTMTQTLEQLLTLARMETPSEVSSDDLEILPILIDGILSKYKDKILEKGLRIKTDLDNSIEYQVPRYYANLILDNAIQNAIKYSEEGGSIFISIQRKNDSVVCSVKDEGIGIKKEDMDKIFNSFYRSDALAHKHISGNGLGLSIAKKSADAIGATLSIESELHRGTILRITF